MAGFPLAGTYRTPEEVTRQVMERLAADWDNTGLLLGDTSRPADRVMTCLTVTHGSFQAGSTMVKKVSGGWPRVLSSLKTFLETGKGLNIFCK